MKKTDIHIHTCLAGQEQAGALKTTPAEKMAEYLKKKEIESGIIMCMGESASPDNEDCMKISKDFPEFHWNCNFDAVNPDTVYDRMALYKEMGAVGVGELCINERLDSRMVTAVFRSAELMELPVLIHMSPRTGYAYGVADDPGLPLLEQTLKKFPRMKLIGHSQVFWIEISGDAPTGDEERSQRGEGKVKPGGRLVELFRQYPNLYGDLSAGSGFCAITRDEEFGLAFLEEFSDRLMFGTDTADVEGKWQVPLDSWLEEKFAQGKISKDTFENICFRTAQRVYGVELETKDTVVLETGCGKIRGIHKNGQNAFLGIRYAAARRFEYPKKVTHWEGVYDGTRFGSCCFQIRSFRTEAMNEDNFYWNEFRKDLHFSYSDDCLNLNIWTPDHNSQKLPVIVFIHGGAFVAGSSAERHLLAPQWTKQGVVAVTLNYRLGPFGFLCTGDGLKESGHTGNYGLYDQLAALEWVREHISDYGGDPENITLMGQSAGGMCVLQLCSSPIARGLFQRAVILSGGGRSETFRGRRTQEENMEFGDSVLRQAGCESLENFRKLSANEILGAFWEQMTKQDRGLSVTGPVIDGHLITMDVLESLESGAMHRIPYLLSCTSQDLWMPELLNAIQDWAAEAVRLGNQDCYTAYFCRQLPGDRRGAFHSSDLWYWFGTLDNSWRPFEERDYELSREMMTYLTSFAKKGNPSAAGIAEWKCYGESYGRIMALGHRDTEQKKVEEIERYDDDAVS